MSVKSYPRMHTSLYVSDLQKSVNFYTSLFGEEPVKVKPGYAKYELEAPALTISFLESPERVQANFGHMGIQLESMNELGQRHGAIKAAGLKTLEEEGVACCYAVQDKFWVADPDGHQWEIYYFHQDSEWNDPQYKLSAEEKSAESVATVEKNCC